jgi:MOSC domain-containing protein YiiM
VNVDDAAPAVASVNVGRPRSVVWQGREVVSAIWKEPVDGPIDAGGVNLVGDDQADRRVHGGADKAIYAYASEDYQWWVSTTGQLAPGTFGENLTTIGVDLNAAAIGDRWRLGTALLEVAQPRSPCFKLGMRMNDVEFPGCFDAARRPGAYLRIIEPGRITAGDRIVIDPAPRPAITIDVLLDHDLDEHTLRQIVDDHRIPEPWRRSAARALAA